MTKQEWIDGSLVETDTDYQIEGQNILYKNEREFLVKGVELLCNQQTPKSVLEFGFGLGWTSTEFQRHSLDTHIILEPNTASYNLGVEWKKDYNTNIEIIKCFSWDYTPTITFDLIYDDRQEVISEKKHEEHMDKILSNGQWYAGWASEATDRRISDYPIFFDMNNKLYAQSLKKHGEYLPCRLYI